jgi:hypothetical protein
LQAESSAVQQAVGAFRSTLIADGFAGLQGRNKPSWVLPRRIKDKQAKKQFAKSFNLHHYHIGVPSYSSSNDGLVSDYYLHYQLLTTAQGVEVRIVGIGTHTPFTPAQQSRLVTP